MKKSQLKSELMKFRTTDEEKKLIEQNAILQGYKNASEFMRFTLLNSCWNV